MEQRYERIRQIRDREELRLSFDGLAGRVFGLSFENWYREGFWSERYIPYVMAEGKRVLSCAAANRMDFELDGERKRLVQIGTVMTDPAHRNRGLASRLIEGIVEEWKGSCDGIYLFANDKALDFYPRFGFRREAETRLTRPAGAGRSCRGDFAKLDMDLPECRKLVLDRYRLPHPYAALSMRENEGLLMFYCAGVLKDCVYYSGSLDLVCVAWQEGDTLFCDDLFGSCRRPLHGALDAAEGIGNGISRIVLGFTPQDAGGFGEEAVGDDDALFFYGSRETPFAGRPLRFPALSHA